MDIITIKVIKSNGSFDDAATEANFRAQYEAFKAEQATGIEDIARAVNAVFDRFDPGTRINLPHLASMAIAELKVNPAKYTAWEERVLDYVRSNSSKKVNGSWERPDALFLMGKGSKEGGVARRVDVETPKQVVPESKPAEMASAAE